jgi:hypothetical protein
MNNSANVKMRIRRFLALSMLTLGCSAAVPANASGQEWTSVPLNIQNFDTSNAATARFENIGGKQVLCLDGEAFVRNVNLINGSIAVDIANDDRRRFANLIFRAASTETYETAYLRMHKSGQPDSVQYTPHLNGETNWQLFREAQATADFGDEPWITLQLDFADDLMNLSLGQGTSEPVMTTTLTLPAQAGAIGLRTLFEGCFSNFRYSTTTPLINSENVPDEEIAETGTIREWSLSAAFPLEEWNALSANPRGEEAWGTAEAEPNGRLLISRYRKKTSSGNFERNQIDGVYAGVAVHSDRAQNATFSIDASDMATIWLNGRALFAFDNSFRAKGLLDRGDFDASKQTLNLQLEEGRNELIVLVAERANGWGLAAALSPAAPVQITPFAVGE